MSVKIAMNIDRTSSLSSSNLMCMQNNSYGDPSRIKKYLFNY